MKFFRIGVLGSGKGSNLQAIVDAIATGSLQAKVAVVISDIQSSGILSIARAAGIPAHFVEPGKFKTKMEPDSECKVVQLLQDAEVELVVLAGYMRIVKEPLLRAFPRRIINIHPSLLPAFRGLEAWRQALEAGVQLTGCTIHYVDSGIDTGEIIAQESICVLPGDTPSTLHARIQEVEHRLYPAIIQKLATQAQTEPS